MAEAENRRVNELNEARETYENNYKLLTEDFDTKLAQAESRRVTELDETTKSFEQKIEEINARFETLTGEHDLLLAQFAAYKKLNGESDDADYSQKEDFEKLERQFSAYYEFFTEKWKGAKRSIRSEFLWQKAKYLRNKI